jgi:hypothetical protein
MGVDQVPPGLEIAVVEWPSGRVLFGGKLAEADWDKVWLLAETFVVDRGCVDPAPEEKEAALFVRTFPNVFALQEGAGHNAASLAEVAYRRATAALEAAPAEVVDPTDWRVVGLESAEGTVVVRAAVPEGRPVPSHVVVPIEHPQVLERPDGMRVVEGAVPLQGLRLAASHPGKAGDTPLWLVPPSTLPLIGWNISVSVWAGQVLVHQEVDTEKGVMELGTVARELADKVATWASQEAVSVEQQYPVEAAGPLPPPPPPGWPT